MNLKIFPFFTTDFRIGATLSKSLTTCAPEKYSEEQRAQLSQPCVGSLTEIAR